MQIVLMPRGLSILAKLKSQIPCRHGSIPVSTVSWKSVNILPEWFKIPENVTSRSQNLKIFPEASSTFSLETQQLDAFYFHMSEHRFTILCLWGRSIPRLIIFNFLSRLLLLCICNKMNKKYIYSQCLSLFLCSFLGELRRARAVLWV